MATTFSFANRFSYPSSSGVSPSVSAEQAKALTDEQLAEESPELAAITSMVRDYSVIISGVSLFDVYRAVTEQSDPRIGFILAAARSRTDNSPLFPGAGAIQEIMFADPGRPNPTNATNRQLFADGIRRISASLAAAYIIGRLSQIEEQAEHRAYLEETALADLQRLVETYELSAAQEEQTQSEKFNESFAPIAFYFTPGEVTIPDGSLVRVSWLAPPYTSDWTLSGEYRGGIQHWVMVADLADQINESIVSSPSDNLIAVAQLSGPKVTVNSLQKDFHALAFYPRRPIQGVIAHSLNVRIEILEDELNPVVPRPNLPTSPRALEYSKSPFEWGPYANSVTDYPVNGACILTQFNRITRVNILEQQADTKVIYFRNKVTYETGGPTPPLGNLKIRITPWAPDLSIDPVVYEMPIERLTAGNSQDQLSLDNSRYSQVAVALLNMMSENTVETKVSGTIIRNDPESRRLPMSAMELVSWSFSESYSHIIVDILQLPSDIEMATGNIYQPFTSFSDKPRSLQVKATQLTGSSSGNIVGSRTERNFVVEKKKPSLWQQIKEEDSTYVQPRRSIF
jgi:hypothetical protein